MNDVYEDPLVKLEAVLLDWDHAFRETRQRMTGRLQSAKTRLELAWRDAEGAKAAVEAVEAATPIRGPVIADEEEHAPLTAALERAREQVSALEQSLDRAYSRIRDLERNRTELLLRIDAFKKAKSAEAADIARLRETVDGLECRLSVALEELHALRDAPPSAPEGGGPERAPTIDPLFDTEVAPEALRREFEAERERFRARLVQIQEETDRSNASLARRLAEALRDRDEAHQRIVELRAEVESMRASAAGAHGGAGLDSGPQRLQTLDMGDGGFTRLRFGQILQRSGVVNAGQLDAALETKKKAPQKPLGAILVEMGLTDEETIGKVLASQLNLPYVELDRRAIDPAAAALIPAKLARHHVCIPLSVERGQLIVAMANPLDLTALEDLELATRRRVDPVIATPTAIGNAIAQHYTSI